MSSSSFLTGVRARAPSRGLPSAFLVAVLLGVLGAAGAGAQEYVVPPPAQLRMLTPFPSVRVVGRATRRGAHFSRVTIRARVGVLLVARCNGPLCPFSKRSKVVGGSPGTMATVHFASLERSFRVGVTLRIYVAKGGFAGKYTSLLIRRNLPPQRYDRCVSGLTLAPVACPAS